LLTVLARILQKDSTHTGPAQWYDLCACVWFASDLISFTHTIHTHHTHKNTHEHIITTNHNTRTHTHTHTTEFHVQNCQKRGSLGVVERVNSSVRQSCSRNGHLFTSIRPYKAVFRYLWRSQIESYDNRAYGCRCVCMYACVCACAFLFVRVCGMCLFVPEREGGESERQQKREIQNMWVVYSTVCMDYWYILLFLRSGAIARTVCVAACGPFELVRTNLQAQVFICLSIYDIILSVFYLYIFLYLVWSLVFIIFSLSHLIHTTLTYYIDIYWTKGADKRYKGVWDTLKKVSNNSLRGSHRLWAGVPATIARDVPFSMCYWPLFEQLKQQITNIYDKKYPNSAKSKPYSYVLCVYCIILINTSLMVTFMHTSPT